MFLIQAFPNYPAVLKHTNLIEQENRCSIMLPFFLTDTSMLESKISFKAMNDTLQQGVENPCRRFGFSLKMTKKTQDLSTNQILQFQTDVSN